MAQKNVEHVAIDRIVCSLNIRKHFADEPLKGLAVTVKEHGVQVALLLLRRTDGTLHLLDGARRLAAAKLAGLGTVPCSIEDGELSDVQIMERQFVVNCQREDLNPIEKAKVLDALIKQTSISATQAASKVGFSNSTVTRLLSLLTLSPELQMQVDNGMLPASCAYEIAQIADPVEQAKAAADVIEGRVTRDGLTGVRKAGKRKSVGETATKPVTRVTTKLSRDRSVSVSGPQLNLDQFIASLEQLLGKARRARTKGLALETFRKILSDQASAEN